MPSNIDSILVQSSHPGRYALNHPLGHEFTSGSRVEILQDDWWHVGKIEHGREGYYFTSDDGKVQLLLRPGLLARLPERRAVKKGERAIQISPTTTKPEHRYYVSVAKDTKRSIALTAQELLEIRDWVEDNWINLDDEADEDNQPPEAEIEDEE